MKGLKKILLPIVLLLLIVAGRTETAYGQQYSHNSDSCVCYTDEMDKKALECLKNAPKKDSIINNYSLQIVNFKSIVKKTEEKSSEYKSAYADEKEISEQLRLDLKKSKGWNKKLTIGGPLTGLIVGILIFKN